MKKLSFIYNPRSGDKKIAGLLDNCIECFQNAGFLLQVYRMQNEAETCKHIESLQENPVDAVVVAGGDGTINLCVNALMQNNLQIPLGILPSGTANDFARHLKLPADMQQCCEIICKQRIKAIDLGKVNDRYFINVCAGGLFSNVSQNMDTHFKNTWGKLAYYVKGIEQIPNFSPIPFIIETKTRVIEEDCFLYLVFNGSGAGGFDMVSHASIEDGLLDFVGIKAGHLMDLAKTVLKLLQGELTKDDNVIHLQEAYFRISLKDKESPFVETDIDGECGPCMPVEIEAVPNALQLFVADENELFA